MVSFKKLIWTAKCSLTVQKNNLKKVIPPGIEPGTLSVLDSRDNRYTTESATLGLTLINMITL